MSRCLFLKGNFGSNGKGVRVRSGKKEGCNIWGAVTKVRAQDDEAGDLDSGSMNRKGGVRFKTFSRVEATDVVIALC